LPSNPCGSGYFYLVYNCNGSSIEWRCLDLADACA
jgi:hypothetical protein